ncbi:hypothetical protein C5167_050950 [Papaver somniferum]|uniref:Uncharacterized protein n=1 Tax=Papaver somniferum TaxID=3469 RepID=A0A4Y7KU49_PAPSO|nr:hypothetical protein C5167_050950 [Papaver somniferum]
MIDQGRQKKRQSLGETPLSWEAIEGCLAAVDYLLEWVPDDSNCSPLQYATMKGCRTYRCHTLATFKSTWMLQMNLAQRYYMLPPMPNLVFHDALTALHSSIRSQSLLCVVSLRKLGLKPVKVTAVKDNCRGVEILFPVTSPIPSYVHWSINEIMKPEQFLEIKSRGTSEFLRKEYSWAVYWYSEALVRKPGDAAVLSNRSLCYVYLNKGDPAFEDATQWVLARPDWPKAYYRAGVALKLLNRRDDAADAFFNGLKLDPENRELRNAFRHHGFFPNNFLIACLDGMLLRLLIEVALPVISLLDDQSIYLDLGGQSEIGGATLETLHQELVERLILISTRSKKFKEWEQQVKNWEEKDQQEMERGRLKVRWKESVSSYQPLFVETIRIPGVCITMHSIPLHQSWVHQECKEFPQICLISKSRVLRELFDFLVMEIWISEMASFLAMARYEAISSLVTKVRNG